jgi:hypothetical protein
MRAASDSQRRYRLEPAELRAAKFTLRASVSLHKADYGECHNLKDWHPEILYIVVKTD